MAPMPSDVVVPQLASQQEVGVSGRHLAGWDAITFVQPGSGQSGLDDASSGGLRADQTDSSELLARMAKAAIARE